MSIILTRNGAIGQSNIGRASKEEKSSSFLKKRTKKLLSIRLSLIIKSFLFLFFKKEILPFLLASLSAFWKDSQMDTEQKMAADLTSAGSAIEEAIESLRKQGLGPMPIASALLGGALGLLAQVMDDNAILNVLHSAATGVASGELRRSLTP